MAEENGAGRPPGERRAPVQLPGCPRRRRQCLRAATVARGWETLVALTVQLGSSGAYPPPLLLIDAAAAGRRAVLWALSALLRAAPLFVP
jgi:hypothetical protein